MAAMATMDIMDIIKEQKRKKFAFFLIGLLSVALCIGLVATYHKGKSTKVNKDSDYRHISYHGKSYKYNTSIISILLLGIDKTEKNPETENELGQSDAMGLLVFDRAKKQVKLISIPRDSITSIEKTDFDGESLGWEKDHINLAYAYGTDEKSGCMKAMRAVSKMMMDIPIARYGSMDLDSLKLLQDIVGTLQVKVPNDSLAKVNGMKKGDVVKITKENVETFVRTRDTDKDYSAQDRLARQQAYYEAFYAKIKSMLEDDFEETVTKLYGFVSRIVTNVSYQDIVTFGNMMLEYKYTSDQNYVLPGKNGKDGDYDAYYLDQSSLKDMIVKIYYE
jgi:anionic cell wall polymer biosynthesis LytR-Cps2A-Psr (LCP) family protein